MHTACFCTCEQLKMSNPHNEMHMECIYEQNVAEDEWLWMWNVYSYTFVSYVHF